MLGHGGSCAGSYLADPTSPIPSHCAVIILFQSASIAVTGTVRVNISAFVYTTVWQIYTYNQCSKVNLTLTVPVTAVDALRHFETG